MYNCQQAKELSILDIPETIFTSLLSMKMGVKGREEHKAPVLVLSPDICFLSSFCSDSV